MCLWLYNFFLSCPLAWWGHLQSMQRLGALRKVHICFFSLREDGTFEEPLLQVYLSSKCIEIHCRLGHSYVWTSFVHPIEGSAYYGHSSDSPFFLKSSCRPKVSCFFLAGDHPRNLTHFWVTIRLLIHDSLFLFTEKNQVFEEILVGKLEFWYSWCQWWPLNMKFSTNSILSKDTLKSLTLGLEQRDYWQHIKLENSLGIMNLFVPKSMQILLTRNPTVGATWWENRYPRQFSYHISCVSLFTDSAW